MIAIIDYGVGNVRSVINAIKHIGCEVDVTRDSGKILRADGIILPGVGAGGFAMKALGETADVIRVAVNDGKPLLGICLGFQLLFDESHEHGVHKCLGLISGKVIPIPEGRTIPHMGWNFVNFAEGMGLFDGLGEGKHFAFAHSYYADVSDSEAKVAYTNYGMELAAAVRKKNVFGCQFHPEKSGNDGLEVLRNFEKICKKRE
jgi:glutamine amidotransferase